MANALADGQPDGVEIHVAPSKSANLPRAEPSVRSEEECEPVRFAGRSKKTAHLTRSECVDESSCLTWEASETWVVRSRSQLRLRIGR